MKKYNNTIMIGNGFHVITVKSDENFITFLLNEKEIMEFRKLKIIQLEATNGKLYNLKLNDINSVLMMEL